MHERTEARKQAAVPGPANVPGRTGVTRAGTIAALLLGSMAGVALVAHALGEPFVVTLATRAAILALAGVGLNLALGSGGLVSFGHAAFFGLGGYAMGVLASHAQDGVALAGSWQGTNVMPLIWLVALLVSGLAALAIGALSLRTSGVYFIMITLAFSQMLYQFAIGWQRYGGEDGLTVYVRNGFPGLDTLQPIQFFALAFALLAAAVLLYAVIERSPFGLALNAAREVPGRVRALGLDVYRLQLVAFVVSGMITGLAGALFADLNRFVSPTMFGWQTSGEIMVFVILGGVGRLAGPVAGAATFVVLEHVLGELPGGAGEHWHVWLGLLLLFVVLFARGGIVGALEDGPARRADGGTVGSAAGRSDGRPGRSAAGRPDGQADGRNDRIEGAVAESRDGTPVSSARDPSRG